ncbi:relaxase/mobilization nuclease domain-containing protein [Mucilaginibacter mali]|uniref:Relaxase/mobilization nuclease domain-containing protein n=1 Tax=Mucilaginibacter mali TaxID=2740462 RepID=A0A7D4TY36_9SPHI|nr:relaxase/mobilization nuclease domain-containing protein [Mucilaginibacter mali]QKJ32875.1 relaxase/mobilization nuclease domain-containing protein [Mucilaginibacter mali]
MVAVIHQSGSLRNILNYNEHKLAAGKAVCLEASGFIKDAFDLNFFDKLRRFEKLTELNQRTTVNSLHISLNFDPSEQLSDECLREIAAVYMDKIGFGEQPYLLYKHNDAGHPHVHLVTTNIKADGKAITLHNLAKIKSKNARLEIEKEFRLVPAEGRKQQQNFRLKPVDAAKVDYGKTETKRAIGNVLNKLIAEYQFASLPELNAVLGLYNIVADAGGDGSRVKLHEGLVFRILDEQGNKVGTPVKASLFHSKPTLKNLRSQFAEKTVKKEPLKPRLKNIIDLILLYGKIDLPEFVAALKKEGIDVVVRQNKDGVVYGITYVDHRQKAVFNGSDLGKGYSAKAILERCANIGASEEKKQIGEKEKMGQSRAAKEGWRSVNAGQNIAGEGKNGTGMGLIETLLDPGYQPEGMDWQLKRSKKKKNRRRLSPE